MLFRVEVFGRGDILYVLPGHNAWVVIGNEPFESVDFTGFKEYAKSGSS
jgi:hypothetical protein